MFLVYPFPLWWLREYTICLTIIIKSEVWTIIHCLGLNYDKSVDVETHTKFHKRQNCKHGAENVTFAAISTGNSSHRQPEGFYKPYNTPKLEPRKASSTCSLILHHRPKNKEKTPYGYMFVLQMWLKWLATISLTHWGRVTHICVSKLSIFGLDNGLSPGRRQAII